MIKGFLGSLIAALVMFAAGAISVGILGRNELEDRKEVQVVDWNGKKLIDERITGEKTWYFDERTDVCEIEVSSSNVKTYIAPSKDNKMSVSVRTNGWKSVSVKAEWEETSDGRLRLSVSGNLFGNFIFGIGNNGTVIICLPDIVYDKLMLELGSGTLEVRDIGAKTNIFDVGSGSFEFSQKTGFTADLLTLDMGSGSVKIANAAADEYDIDMGSGKFDISGLTGSGKIDIGSGRGTAEFTEVGAGESVFELGSGRLDVYIPEDTKADLIADIGAGSVSVNCCGVSETLRDNEHIRFNGGSEEVTLRADLGSGKAELLNSSKYERPDMFEDFPKTLVFNSENETVINQVTMTDDGIITN